MNCPLCGSSARISSFVGVTEYDSQQFVYVRCGTCRSFYTDPMPGPETLAQMYGSGYSSAFAGNENGPVNDPKQMSWSTGWLAKLDGGTFLDYGCGAGRLLTEAAQQPGWKVVGFEYDLEVARETARKTGLSVFSDHISLVESQIAPVDVIHLGDVIEHLTDLDRQMPEILRLLRPGGVLLAQGPLEGSDPVLMGPLRLARALGHGGRRSGAPYHVLLATRDGQSRFFERFGLSSQEYSTEQVDWPCPSRLGWAELSRPRALILYTFRRASQALGKVLSHRLVNRYYFAGRVAQVGSTEFSLGNRLA